MVNEVEQLTEAVSRQWSEDKTTVIFTMLKTDRSSVDVYIEGNLDIMRNWDNSSPLYTIQDISHPDVNLTTYLQSRLKDVTDCIKENQINTYSAIVLENNFTGQVMRAFGRILAINAYYLTQSFFLSLAEAQEWIKEQQAQNTNKESL